MAMAWVKVLSQNLLGDTEENSENLSNDGQSLDQGLKLVSPRYEAAVLIAQLQCLFQLYCICTGRNGRRNSIRFHDIRLNISLLRMCIQLAVHYK